MLELQLPERYRPGFRRVLLLSDEATAALASALSEAPPALLPDQLAQSVAERTHALVPDVSQEEVVSIVEALISLYSLRDYLNIEIPEFVDNLQQAATKSEGILEEIEDAEALFQSRFSRLLGLDGSLEIASKALGVLLDSERVFVRARLLTDIRPIFRADPNQPPAGLTITHTMRIEYREGSRDEQFFVSLSPSGIRQLRDALDRAEAKEVSLKAFLVDAKAPILINEWEE